MKYPPRLLPRWKKILENTYRNINIGLVNELTMLCNEMGISMWEVIDAAKTKPLWISGVLSRTRPWRALYSVRSLLSVVEGKRIWIPHFND